MIAIPKSYLEILKALYLDVAAKESSILVEDHLEPELASPEDEPAKEEHQRRIDGKEFLEVKLILRSCKTDRRMKPKSSC